LKTDDALAAGMKAGNSGQVMEYAKSAQASSNAAKEYADEADEKADEAYVYYLEAKADYEEALKVAEEANAAADQAVKDALEDADEAVEYAKKAEEKANNLKAAMDKAYNVSAEARKGIDNELQETQGEIDALEAELKALNKELDDNKNADALLKKSQEAYNEAEEALKKAPTDEDIAKLEKTLADLNAELEEYRKTCDTLEGSSKEALTEKEAKESLYNQAKSAYKAIESLYETAKANKETIDSTIAKLNQDKEADVALYGGDIVEKQDVLRRFHAAHSVDEPYFAKQLIEAVYAKNDKNLADSIRVGTEASNVYYVKDGDKVTYYTLEITDDYIRIIDCSKYAEKTEIRYGYTHLDNATKEKADEMTAGKDENSYYIIENSNGKYEVFTDVQCFRGLSYEDAHELQLSEETHWIETYSRTIDIPMVEVTTTQFDTWGIGAFQDTSTDSDRPVPHFNNNYELIYVCEVTVDGIKYSSADGTLYPERGYWMVKVTDSEGNIENKRLDSIVSEEYRDAVKVREYCHTKIVTPEEAETITDFKAKTDITQQETVYDVLGKTGSEYITYGYKTLDTATNLVNYTAKLQKADEESESIGKEIEGYKSLYNNYQEALKNRDDATTNYNEACANYQSALSTYGEKSKECEKAAKDVEDAKAAKETAEANVSTARAELEAAENRKKNAASNIRRIKGEISAYNGKLKGLNYKKSVLEKSLKAANKQADYWQNKLALAKSLAENAEKARIKAEEARDAIKALKASNAGTEALAVAKARLEAAETAYKEAREKADLAAKDAEEAEKEYQRLVERAAGLAEEEAKNAGSSSDDETDTTVRTLLATETPELVAAPAAGGRARAAVAVNTTATETVTDTTTVEETQTPLEASIDNETEKVETTEIAEQETALAATPIEEESLGWWWLIIVGVLGGAGYAIYKKNQEKKAKETAGK